MSKKFPWFRLYANDLLGDRKIKRINKVTGISLAEIRGVWLSLLCLASESPERGSLLFDGGVPYDYDDLVEECGLDSLKFHTLFMHFTKMGMMAFIEEDGIYYLPAWNERQPISDTTGAKRVAEHRARKKEDVTLQKRYSNTLEEESESEEEEEPAAWTEPYIRRFIESLTGVFLNVDINRLENTKIALETHGEKKTRESFELALDGWKKQKRKDNGQNYSVYNPGWIDWGIEHLSDGVKRWEVASAPKAGVTAASLKEAGYD